MLISMTVPHAAGALVSTVDDLLKWNLALHQGRVLKHPDYVQMITPVGKAREAKYGYGIELSTVQGHPILEHGGRIFGFESMLEYLPGPDISVIVLQNTDRNDNDKSPDVIARKLAAEALGEPYPEAKAIPMDVSALKQFEGVYRINGEDARVLRVVDGKLTSQRPGGQGSALIPIGTDQFLYSDGLTRIAMQRDKTGTVTAMHFFSNGEPPGTLIARSPEPLPPLRKEVPLPPEALERVLGTYSDGTAHLKIFKEGTQLKAQMNGQPAVDIFAESPDHFSSPWWKPRSRSSRARAARLPSR